MKETDRQVDRQRQTDRQANFFSGRFPKEARFSFNGFFFFHFENNITSTKTTDRQIDRQTGRQTDRQTETDNQTDR